MNIYTSKLSHTLAPFLFICIGAAFMYYSFTFAAWSIYALAFFSLWYIGVIGWLQAKTEHTASIADLARSLATLDPERYNALGIHIPEIRVYSSGNAPVFLVEDRYIKYEFLRELLMNCNDHEFTPSSRYDKETVALKQWKEAAKLLVDRGYLIDRSASGNHGMLWHSGGRQACIKAYFGNETNLFHVQEVEGE